MEQFASSSLCFSTPSINPQHQLLVFRNVIYQELPEPQLIRFPEDFLPENTQPPHSPKNQRRHWKPKAKYPTNKNKICFQHLDLKSSLTQMLRCHGKNKLNDHQDHMHSLEPSKPTTEGCSYYSAAEAQERDLKISFMNVIEVLPVLSFSR